MVADGRVFVTDAELLEAPSARERVHCLEETTGKLFDLCHKVTYSKWAFVSGQETAPFDADRGSRQTPPGGERRRQCLTSEMAPCFGRRTWREYEVADAVSGIAVDRG